MSGLRPRLAPIAGQALRFGAIGLAATALHVLVALTAAALGLTPQMSNLAGFAAAVNLSYFGHFYLTFRLGTHAAATHDRHLPRFVIVSLAGLALSSALVSLLTGPLGLPFAYAIGVVAVAVPAFSFAMSRLWAFRISTGASPH